MLGDLTMFSGAHLILYSPAAEAVRGFLRDVLEFDGVDAGDGWLIVALPPAELAVHPAEQPAHELMLMTDDLEGTLAVLAGKGILPARPITTQRWGRLTAIALPDGSELGLYEPSHARPAHHERT
jgi:hypothetical protein